MANENHVALLRQGVEVWNAWREDYPDVVPDLRNSLLGGANLKGARLDRAGFNRAILSHCNLQEARLRGASLQSTILNMSNLDGANLDGAFLRGARLNGASLDGVSLNRASFRRVRLNRTVLANIDFSSTVDLGTCVHGAPSIINNQTLTRSGPLPLALLRGCGLSDWEIEATKLHQQGLSEHELTTIAYNIVSIRSANPIDYYSCFISYSHADQAFARELHDALQERGIRCWLDERQLLPGDNIYDQVDRGIRL